VGNLHRVGGAAPRGLIASAARTSLLLSLLFIGVYGGTNWVSSLRSDVGTCYFAWELALPFVPWMILPYMSIDLFFVVAPFLCADAEELAALRKRIGLAILTAGACFLAFPLHVGFAKPQADGVLGWVFETFLGFDQPYNLVPSLHITLGVLLAKHYARHSRGAVRAALLAWFGLVMLSTVLTHQHHVADVAGGLVLGVLCFFLVRERGTVGARTGSLRIAGYYSAGTAALLAMAWVAWPLGVILLWPAFGTAVMTAAYLGLGAGVYGKHDGRLPWSSRLVLAPILIGHYLSLVYYRRHCQVWDEVAPGVRIGAGSTKSKRLLRSRMASPPCST
jgi:membrane-associated phospholipid phosphatase